ncbi:hypothetical protein AGMMS50293_19330 [Spirochaetia bacterium]|nr:hypothetical protein AGMMS50293_19330 [Spirochaetia bacterium]
MKKLSKKILSIFFVMLVGLFVSCLTGQYKPLKASANTEVLGTIQTSFTMQRVTRQAINTQSYIHLMEAASQKYQGNFDVVDITWAIGRQMNDGNTEYTATGKVIKM